MKNIKTFVINLEKRKDRLEELEIPFEYEIFIATDGQKKFENENYHSRKRAALGCFDSHKRLLEKIYSENIEFAIIFEDDVVLCEDFKTKLSYVSNQLPHDWDLFYLGGWNLGEKINFSENLNIVEKVYTTHSYMIRKKMIPFILNEMKKPDSSFKVDVLYSQIQKQHKCFIANPILCWQRPGFSDIENKITNNTHLL